MTTVSISEALVIFPISLLSCLYFVLYILYELLLLTRKIPPGRAAECAASARGYTLIPVD